MAQMIFYIRRTNHYIDSRSTKKVITEDLCFVTKHSNRKYFIEHLERMNADSSFIFVEVPESCAKKLFGKEPWPGGKSWPK